jgi:hypothetical protein
MTAAAKPFVQTHSYKHFQELELSPASFYDLVENMIKEYQYPEVSTRRMNLSEGGMFSPSREYLCITRGKYMYNVCATPFGKSFLISWWLKKYGHQNATLLSRLPLIGKYLARKAYMKTHYQLDMELLFMQSIDALIKEALNRIKAKNNFLERATIVSLNNN